MIENQYLMIENKHHYFVIYHERELHHNHIQNNHDTLKENGQFLHLQYWYFYMHALHSFFIAALP